MAENEVTTAATDCKTVDHPEQPERDEAFEADLDRRLKKTMEEYREQARRIHYAPPVDYSQREQLRRSTHRRVGVLLGYVALAAHVLDKAANAHEEPLDDQTLDTLARLLTRASRGIEDTVCNAHAFD